MYMDSVLTPSRRRPGRLIELKCRLQLAGSALNFLGEAQEASAQIISSLVPTDARVLNMGRANRRFVRQLKARQPASRVVQLRRPVSRDERETLPYRSRTFDAMNCLFSLHYWRNLPEAFSEMARALAPGGVLAFSELSVEDGAADWERTRSFAGFTAESAHIADYYRWLDSAGLRVQEAFPTFSGRHGLLIVAEKDSE